MNIILTGMPASGKTTAAAALKKLLKDYALIDTDKEIVKSTGMSINDIFAKYGAEYFRELETKVLQEVLKKDNQIISSGGGIVTRSCNIEIIKEKSVSIYLKADIETLLKRAAKSTERPLLKGGDAEEIKEKLEILFNERREKYIQSAHIIIDTENKTPDEEAEEILKKINEYFKCKN